MSSLTHTPSQRAFVGKRSRMTAADARKIVMTGSLLLHQPASDVPDGSEEAFLQRKTSAFYDTSSSTSSSRKVSEFPADDIEVRIVSREQHTLDLPYKITPRDVIDHHIKDMAFSFTDSFALVQRRYQQFGSGDAYMRMVIERPIIVRNTSRPLFEANGVARRQERIARSASVVAECESAADNISKRNSYTSSVSTGTMNSMEGERETKLHWSQPDPIVPGVIQLLSFAQLDQLTDGKRSIGRQPNLVNLLPVQCESDVIERRSPPSYPDDRSGQKLLVKLTLEPYFEPIFGSIAIYDSKKNRKVTENFYFDVNSDSIRSLIPALIKEAEPLARSSQGCFNVNAPFSDLFLVIKLDKVRSASDVFDCSELYTNPAKDDKSKEKLSHSAKEYCAKLGCYRPHFGFMLIDLQKVIYGADTLERSDIMTASTFNSAFQGEAPLACGESDIQSIVSADRISIASTSTFERMGSGTSSVTVLNRVRTPLAKRKIFGSGGDDQSAQMSSSSLDQPKLTQNSSKSIRALLTRLL